MEELKEVDMNYLINEDSDADDIYQNSASKKKKNTLLGKIKEIDEVTFQPFASPYIEAEQRHIGDQRPASGVTTHMAPEDNEVENLGVQSEHDNNMPMSRDDLRPDIDEELIVRDMMFLNNNNDSR